MLKVLTDDTEVWCWLEPIRGRAWLNGRDIGCAKIKDLSKKLRTEQQRKAVRSVIKQLDKILFEGKSVAIFGRTVYGYTVEIVLHKPHMT